MNNNNKLISNQIICNITIPDHSEELCKAEILIKKNQIKVKKLYKQKHISNIQHDFIYEDTIRILDYIGRLSMEIFNLENDLENFYFKTYKHSPELAKKLWLDHYDNIHHPYDLLKNRCFRILDDIDELYISIHKKYPPNWNARCILNL